MVKIDFRKIVRKYLNEHPSMIKVVSFDVFDTILVRKVPSTCVNKIAAGKLSHSIYEENSICLSVEDILTSRAAYQHNKENRDWAVSEWIESLSREKRINHILLQKAGRKAEIEAEIQCLRTAEGVLDAFNTLKKYNFKVIATSDIWLDQAWLKDLLNYFGLEFDSVFSSGTIKASKKQGSIFSKIEKHFNLAPQNFLHIGDNLETDFIKPRVAGWKTVWTPKVHHKLRIWIPKPFYKGPLGQSAYEQILEALTITSALKHSDPFYHLAYDYLSPLMIIFSLVQWRIFRSQHIDIVFYIARDAWMMLDVCNLISDLLPDSCPRHYIRLSRRAVTFAHPDDVFQNVIHLAGKVGRKTVSEWFGNFVIDSELQRQILEEANLTETANFTESARRSLRSACKAHLSQIKKNQRDQRDILRDYLCQEAENSSMEKVGIIDSGWACTTQDAIRGALNETKLVSGVYLGVSNQGHSPNSQNMKYGLLRDDYRKLRHQNPVEMSAGVVRVWDTLLREPTETVLQLQRLPDNKVEPVLDKFGVIGRIERSAADLIRKGVREGTIARRKGVSLLAELSEKWTDGDLEIAATKIAQKISTNPNRKIAKAIMQLGFDEGFAEGRRSSVGINSIKDGIAWYPGILASAGLKWALPILKVGARIMSHQRN